MLWEGREGWRPVRSRSYSPAQAEREPASHQWSCRSRALAGGRGDSCELGSLPITDSSSYSFQIFSYHSPSWAQGPPAHCYPESLQKGKAQAPPWALASMGLGEAEDSHF